MPLIRVFCEGISPPDWKEKARSKTNHFLDVWRIPLSLPDHLFEALKGLLTDEEIQQAERYVQKEDRIRNLLGKGFLRKLIQVYLKVGQKTVHFGKSRYNKPFLIGSDNFHFNISHAGKWVVIALSESEVGIDVESINYHLEYKELLAGFFSPSEIEFIEHSSNPVHSFYKIWTRKEALLKGTGLGITDYLNEYCLTDGPQHVRLPDVYPNREWQVKSFPMDQNHYLSLAIGDNSLQPSFFNWNKILR